MTRGERLYRAKCRPCHILPQPQDHTDREWLDLFEDHVDRTKITDSDRQKILEYLQQGN